MRLLSRLSVASLSFAISLSAYAVRVGDQAPAFTGVDSHGKTHSLSEYRGKYVVLEWTNNGCPYTKKHYESGNMQALQKQWTTKGVVWLTVLSSAQGNQGYMSPAEENAYMSKVHADPTAALLDPSGAIGHLYEAKTTPDMFVIDPQGKLIYAGAIDDHPTTDTSDVAGSKNYVSAALTESMNGQPVATGYTRPYGCSVKYAGAE
ncbi:thioredoxin family protein [Silvibacterium dinghuense]|uniref:Thioredoxin family protein n=1 Tax=Silvibacterium dinghuense TaxID=1560006 RepID=A0A4Q1SFU5_9BACT|nr:thioredoxin family protein [Silvibacterium dinghuense]RXS96438.1 thioredoxin family protein [Silvibacterium dinghuense]GGG90762.1 thioredoxin family protein [Silvibacterium dinghuense]